MLNLDLQNILLNTDRNIRFLTPPFYSHRMSLFFNQQIVNLYQLCWLSKGNN